MRDDLLRLLGEELRLLRSEGIEKISLSDKVMRLLDRPASAPAPSIQPTSESKAVANTAERVPTKIILPDSLSKGASASPRAKQTKLHDPTLVTPPTVSLPDGSKLEQWEWLKNRVLTCEVCLQHLNLDKKLVFGVGNLDADIFFCGEAPGADEEMKGEPFVGKAGELLNGMIKAMGLSRGDVYIGNIMNWRPQTGNPFGNRPPTDEEMAFCLPYLKAQIEVIRPKVIVALGGTAVKGLLGIETKGQMGRLRGQWHTCENTPVMVTYHPSFLLHQGTVESKRKVWEDLLSVMEKVDLEISQKQRNFFLSAIKG